jgi:hypothetical protein
MIINEIEQASKLLEAQWNASALGSDLLLHLHNGLLAKPIDGGDKAVHLAKLGGTYPRRLLAQCVQSTVCDTHTIHCPRAEHRSNSMALPCRIGDLILGSAHG